MGSGVRWTWGEEALQPFRIRLTGLRVGRVLWTGWRGRIQVRPLRKSSLMRRLRAILVISVTWAIPWAVLGVLFGAYRYWDYQRNPTDVVVTLPSQIGWSVALGAIWRALSGAAFASILSIAERHSKLGELRMAHVTAWGATGSTMIPLITLGLIGASDPLMVLPLSFVAAVGAVSAALGAGLAAGTLGVARRSERLLPP